MTAKILPQSVDKLPFCFQLLIRQSVPATIIDTERRSLIAMLYRVLKTTKGIKVSEYNAVIEALNGVFTNPLTPDELKDVINTIIVNGDIIKPVCADYTKLNVLKELCDNYNKECPFVKQEKKNQIKQQQVWTT